MWVFDSPDGTGRLLRSREGHRAPPRAIRYYGNTTLATMAEGAGESQFQTNHNRLNTAVLAVFIRLQNRHVHWVRNERFNVKTTHAVFRIGCA